MSQRWSEQSKLLLSWCNRAVASGCFRWYERARNPVINERLHWHRILVVEKAEQLGNGHKVKERRVEVRHAGRKVIERLGEMRMVEMRVEAEHLTKNVLQIIDKRFGEAGVLSNPVRARKRR